MNKLKVFLVEDHAIVREGLKLLVNSQEDMEVVGEAGDGNTAWTSATQVNPDVVVMDISLPEMSGAQATRRIVEISPTVKVLALTVHEDTSYLRELLQAGASGYILKRSAAQDLITAIHVVMKGGTYLDPSLAGKIVSGFSQHPAVDKPEMENKLSLRESEVLRLIAQGYTNREVAEQLKVSTKTVETYKYRLIKKLGLRNRSDIIRYALKRGMLKDI